MTELRPTLERAMAHLRGGDSASARREAEAALAGAPDDVRLLHFLGSLCCHSGSRSLRCPMFSLMDQVLSGFRVSKSAGMDRNFSSSRTGVPRSRSIIDGKIFWVMAKSNFRSNHFT